MPMSLREARAYVDRVHRHHRAPQGGLFAIGLEDAGAVVGCAIVGKPVARMLDDDYTAEVTRLATDGSKNACSMLYAAAWRAARAMGYRRLVTYILGTEPGTSLDAAGWTLVGTSGGGSWNRAGRPRVDTHPTEPKLRWEAVVPQPVRAADRTTPTPPATPSDSTAAERCGCSICPCSNPSEKDWRWCIDCESGNHVAGYRAPTPPTDGAA